MKAHIQSSKVPYLQKKNNRWKWMAGATAATAAGTTAAQASLITINLTGNFISATGNHLNADLTGDGHPDITLAKPFYSVHYGGSPNASASGRHSAAQVNINGIAATAFFGTYDHVGGIRLGPKSQTFTGSSVYNHTHTTLTGSIPVFFKDLHINSGAPTEGFLEVTVSGPSTTIQLDSLTYTSNAPLPGSLRAVPDQGSSLALLAMGAGGVLALRRWRAAQNRS